MRSSRVEGGTVGLFPGSLLLKDMVTLVISLKVSFFFSSSSFSFLFFFYGGNRAQGSTQR